MSIRALGIFRETLHSPEREFDDYEILRLTGEHLTREGLNVILKKPEDVLLEKRNLEQSLPELVFIMCEQKEILQILENWESEDTTIVNSPQSVLNTYRDRTIPLLRGARISFPESELVLTSKSRQLCSPLLDELRKSASNKKLWIKRGDFHNTRKGDVVLTSSVEEVISALDALHARGISQAVLQEDVPGDLIKFYGISDSQGDLSEDSWFKWFYHKNQILKKYPFSEAQLQEVTRTIAQKLSLEIYGGDAIVTADGRLGVIDINAWPSFALFRKDASEKIARFLVDKISKKIQKV